VQLSQPVAAVSEYKDPHQPFCTSVNIALLAYNFDNAAAEFAGKVLGLADLIIYNSRKRWG
jgi:hypothetical protein